METINPKDISKLDTKDIAFITLKNNNKIMVDESAPEKLSKKSIKTNDNIRNNKFQKILISKNINFSYKGKENKNILNLKKTNSNTNNINNQNIQKNDFNLISQISKNIYFSFNRNISKDKSNDKPIKKEEEKVNMAIKRKSRNSQKGVNPVFGEKNDQQKADNNIYFSIYPDLNKHYNSTQKKFISLVQQLRQKRIKNSSSIKDKASYNKYYELYKNNEKNNLIKNIHFNRLKHYEEKAMEDNFKEKEKGKDIFDKNIFNSFKTSTIDYSDNNTFYCGINDSLRTSTISCYKQNTRSSSEIKVSNHKLKSGRIGYSSTLVFPLNIFKSKLNS